MAMPRSARAARVSANLAASAEASREASASESDAPAESEMTPFRAKGRKRKARQLNEGPSLEEARCIEHPDWPEKDCLACQEFIAALTRGKAPVRGEKGKKKRKLTLEELESKEANVARTAEWIVKPRFLSENLKKRFPHLVSKGPGIALWQCSLLCWE